MEHEHGIILFQEADIRYAVVEIVLFQVKVQPIYILKCEESSIRKNESFEKNEKVFCCFFQFKIIEIY